MKLNVINKSTIVANIIKSQLPSETLESKVYQLYEFGEYVKDISQLEADYYCRKARELGLIVANAYTYNGWVIRER